MRGTIKSVKGERGFAFISGEDQEDYFLHCRDFSIPMEDAYPGLEVVFEGEDGPKGMRARRARPVE